MQCLCWWQHHITQPAWDTQNEYCNRLSLLCHNTPVAVQVPVCCCLHGNSTQAMYSLLLTASCMVRHRASNTHIPWRAAVYLCARLEMGHWSSILPTTVTFPLCLINTKGTMVYWVNGSMYTPNQVEYVDKHQPAKYPNNNKKKQSLNSTERWQGKQSVHDCYIKLLYTFSVLTFDSA